MHRCKGWCKYKQGEDASSDIEVLEEDFEEDLEELEEDLEEDLKVCTASDLVATLIVCQTSGLEPRMGVCQGLDMEPSLGVWQPAWCTRARDLQQQGKAVAHIQTPDGRAGMRVWERV